MRNLSILQKFFLLGILFGAVLLVQNALLLTGAHTINQYSGDFSKRVVPMLNKAHELKLAVVQVQQWLTDVSATRGKDGMDDGFDEAAKNAKAVRQLLQELEQLDPQHAQRYRQILPAFEAYYATGQKMARAYVEGGPDAGNKMMSQFDGVAEKLSTQVDDFLAGTEKRASTLVNEQRQRVDDSEKTVIIAFVAIIIVIVLVTGVITGAMRELPRLVNELDRVAHGDLSGKSAAANRGDEIGHLARGIDEMKRKLQEILSNVTDSATQLTTAAEQMTSTTSRTRDASEQQQMDVNQVATAMNEMSATAQGTAEHAAAAAEAANEADSEIQAGKAVMVDAMQSIESLASEMAAAAGVVQKLEQDSVAIGGILDVIRGIAEQTNLLALNAAIEAARAGEQGRGFAVVAEEVRALAQRTQVSTRQIHDVIEQLQQGARAAVEVMEHSKDGAESSMTRTSEAGERLEAISRAISTINEMNHQIAGAAREQSSVTEEMDRNITSINRIAETTVSGAQEIEQASRQVSTLAQRLQQLVSRFIT